MDVLHAARNSSPKFDAFVRDTHAAIDTRRGGQGSFLGIDYLLSAPLNRVTAYERCLEQAANNVVDDGRASSSNIVDDDARATRVSLLNAFVVVSQFSESLRGSLERAENRAALMAIERSGNCLCTCCVSV